MNPWLDDGDLRLYHGDALETVRQLPDESVDCVVTSPPYWGLRDYGTGEWEGGDPECAHNARPLNTRAGRKQQGAGGASHTNTYGFRGSGPGGSNPAYIHSGATPHMPFGDNCGKCGARRVDQQMGLEPTPDLFVQNMVELFREIRRVLAPHGTCWVNLGDSYNSRLDGSHGGWNGSSPEPQTVDHRGPTNSWSGQMTGLAQKNLMGMPWRVAFGLQADGWILRSDIIWAKPNPMPESVTDRPTKAHEYVFLLTKQPRYWFDAEAVREAYEGDPEYRYGRVGAYQNRAINGIGDGTTPTRIVGPDGRRKTTVKGADGSIQHRDGERWPNAGRNVRSVWQIATQPYPEAHFATYPEELARRCILAGCPVRVCRECGKPSERIVDVSHYSSTYGDSRRADVADSNDQKGSRDQFQTHAYAERKRKEVSTLGWSDCGHNNWRPGQVLDPFIGSGTTAKVARDHQRHAIGIDLNEQYLELAARRLQQLSLLNAS